MLTVITQAAISVLHDISSGECLQSANFQLSEEELSELLHKLEAGGLVRRLPEQKECIRSSKCLLSSYELCRPFYDISLLDVIEATGEPVNCKRPTPESFYTRHGRIAHKMGIANHMIRLFLGDIKLSDW